MTTLVPSVRDCYLFIIIYEVLLGIVRVVQLIMDTTHPLVILTDLAVNIVHCAQKEVILKYK